MTQSLDGYVAYPDGTLFGPPGPKLFAHFIEHEQGLAGAIYGRRVYELLRYWDEDRPEWEPHEHAFARAWRAHPKWIASRTLTSVGPNAMLVADDLEGFVRTLKGRHAGVIAVAGPDLAASITRVGLLDEYHLYVRPIVLGSGIPYFAETRPKLELIGADRVGEDAVRLSYRAAHTNGEA